MRPSKYYYLSYVIFVHSLLDADTVKQVRKDAIAASEWVRTAKEKIDSKELISLSEAKKMLDTGSRLRFTCAEYKYLRKEYQSAKAWEKKVKKSGIEDGSTQIYEIRELIKAHESFFITLPKELDALKQAMCGYCICRRPYEGFMIGCDECDEWYHGSCIGMSQAQGEKIEKYVCVRCCVKKVYKNASNSLALVIRKWCDNKELNKARCIESQKHQRKVREKKREQLRLNEDLSANKFHLEDLWDEERKKELHLLFPDIFNIDISKAPLDAIDLLSQYSSQLGLTSEEIEKLAKIKYNVLKTISSLEQCDRRIEELSKLSFLKKVTQGEEDQLISAFRYWVVSLRTQVVAPEKMCLANESRPNFAEPLSNARDMLSTPMKEILELAKKLGISKFPDIELVQNSFQCVSWCLYAFSLLQKKPKHEDLKCLVRLGANIKLPEVKSLGMIKSMISRTAPWRVKVNKALSATSGTKQSLDSSSLKGLLVGAHSIPITTEEEGKLYDALEERGICVDRNSHEGLSKHAPDPMQMWPPFGLSNSAEAVTALGNALKVKIEQFRLSTPTKSSSNGVEKKVYQEERDVQQQISSQSKQAVPNREKVTTGQTFTNLTFSANHTSALLSLKTESPEINGKYEKIQTPQEISHNATCKNQVQVAQGLSEEDAAAAARIVANVMKRCKADTSESAVSNYFSSSKIIPSANEPSEKNSTTQHDNQMTLSRRPAGEKCFSSSTLPSKSKPKTHLSTDGNSKSLPIPISSIKKIDPLIHNTSQGSNNSSLRLSVRNTKTADDDSFISNKKLGILQNVTSPSKKELTKEVAVPPVAPSLVVRPSMKIVEVEKTESTLLTANPPLNMNTASQQSLAPSEGISNVEMTANTCLNLSQIASSNNISPTKEPSIEIAKDAAVAKIIGAEKNESKRTLATSPSSTVISGGSLNNEKAANAGINLSRSIFGNIESPTVEVGKNESKLKSGNPPSSTAFSGCSSNNEKAANTGFNLSRSIFGNKASPTVEVGKKESKITSANPPRSIDKATQQLLPIKGGSFNDDKVVNTGLHLSQSISGNNTSPTQAPSLHKTTFNSERINAGVNGTTNQITAPNP